MRVLSRFLNILFVTFVSTVIVQAQNSSDNCEIMNRVSPDGALFYFTRPVRMDSSTESHLQVMILTDGFDYFLAVLPKTKDSFKKIPKLKEQLTLEFEDNSSDSLEPYDLQLHRRPEEIVILFFRMKDDQLRKILSSSVQKLRFRLSDEADSSYEFAVNSNLLKEKIRCLLKLKSN